MKIMLFAAGTLTGVLLVVASTATKEEQQQLMVSSKRDVTHCNACDSGVFTRYADGNFRCSFCGAPKMYPAALLPEEDVK